ncbi:MAG: hypothetical protein RLN70_07170, partial [Rhodospirillaceae bacterium]
MSEPGEKLQISSEQFNQIVKILAANPAEAFLSAPVRQFFASDRWRSGGRHMRVYDDIGGGVTTRTIEHNKVELERDAFGSFRR